MPPKRSANPSSELREAIVDRLAHLLEIDEAGWPAIATWLDSRALEEGIDLNAERKNPKAWAKSVVDTLTSYIDPEKFSEGALSLENFDTAEGLFWQIFPDWQRTGL